MGLLRSSWWLILGLFLHLTHLLASMWPPIVAVTWWYSRKLAIGCHSVLFAPMPPSLSLPPSSFPPCPLSRNSMNTFLVCSEEHPGAHYVMICLSCFVSPLNPAHEICGEGAFSLGGALRRPRRSAESIASQRYRFYVTEKYPRFSLSEWAGGWAGHLGLRALPSPGKTRAMPPPGASLFSVCCHLTAAQIRETPKISSKMLREMEVLGMGCEPFLLAKLWKKHPEKLSSKDFGFSMSSFRQLCFIWVPREIGY